MLSEPGTARRASPGVSGALSLASCALAWALYQLTRVPSDPTLSVTKRTIGTL